MTDISGTIATGPSASEHAQVRDLLNTPHALVLQMTLGQVSLPLPTTECGLRSLTSALVPLTNADNLANILESMTDMPALHQVEYMRALLLHVGADDRHFIIGSEAHKNWCIKHYRLVMGCDFSA
jgi:hypothetical protein